MDSKRKYVRSKCLKRKNRLRHVTSDVTNSTKAVEKKDELVSADQSSDVENQFLPKQPIPKGGWFPEYDSSSSSDFEKLDNLSDVLSNALEPKSDKNWFEKELDNIKLSSDLSTINEQNDENRSTRQIIVKTKHQTSDPKRISNTIKKTIEQKNGAASSIDNDEELEFLLSLKEPVYSGPLIVKQNIEDDRRFVPSNNASNEQKPVKSIDLEKWLDSVLDDR